MNSFLKKFFALTVITIMALFPLGVAFGDSPDGAVIESASITVNGDAVAVELGDCGLKGAVDLYGFGDLDYVTGGSIEVSEAATLTLTGITDEAGEDVMFSEDESLLDFLIEEGLATEQELEAGDNDFDLLDYLGELDPQDDGVSMGLIRAFEEDVIVVKGSLGDQEVQLALTLVAPFQFGDVNGDGVVNVQDAILILRNIVNLADLDETQEDAADVNGDGVVNVQDAILVLRDIVNLIDYFPVEVAEFEAASITVAGDKEAVVLEECGLIGSIDLSAFEGTDYVTAGSVAVNRNATLEVTGFVVGADVEAEVEEMLEALIGDSAVLEAGVDNVLDLSDFLGDLDPQGDGVSLELIRDLLGESVTIEGELTADFGVAQEVALTIILIAEEAVDENGDE